MGEIALRLIFGLFAAVCFHCAVALLRHAVSAWRAPDDYVDHARLFIPVLALAAALAGGVFIVAAVR